MESDGNSGSSGNALIIRIEAADGGVVQQLRVDGETGGVTFPLGDAPVLGFGQGGPQFDRRGVVDACAAARARISFGRTADACRFPG